MRHKNQCLRHNCRPDRLPLTVYFEAGLAAGAAAFSSLTGVLFAGFAASFLATAVFVASALATSVALLAAGSAAKTDVDSATAKIAISLFILFSFEVK